jgi:hypothetical protein
MRIWNRGKCFNRSALLQSVKEMLDVAVSLRKQLQEGHVWLRIHYVHKTKDITCMCIQCLHASTYLRPLLSISS